MPRHRAEPRRWRPAPLFSFSVLLHAAGAVLLAFRLEAWPWVLGMLLANHALVTAAVLWPRSGLLGPNIVRLPASSARRGEVCITFDDGPDPQITPQVLDILDACQAKASFFCIAEKAKAHLDIVKDIVRRGHSVENHSYRHRPGFAFYGWQRLRGEIDQAQTAIGDITGVAPLFFRAPFGFRGPFLDRVLASRDMHYVSWTRRGFDAVWRDPDRVLDRLSKGLAAGDVLLLHDSHAQVLSVLPRLMGEIASRELRSVTLPAAFRNRP